MPSNQRCCGGKPTNLRRCAINHLHQVTVNQFVNELKQILLALGSADVIFFEKYVEH